MTGLQLFVGVLGGFFAVLLTVVGLFLISLWGMDLKNWIQKDPDVTFSELRGSTDLWLSLVLFAATIAIGRIVPGECWAVIVPVVISGTFLVVVEALFSSRSTESV